MISRNERRKNPRPLQNFRLIPSDSTIALFGILFTAAYKSSMTQLLRRKLLWKRSRERRRSRRSPANAVSTRIIFSGGGNNFWRCCPIFFPTAENAWTRTGTSWKQSFSDRSASSRSSWIGLKKNLRSSCREEASQG